MAAKKKKSTRKRPGSPKPTSTGSGGSRPPQSSQPGAVAQPPVIELAKCNPPNICRYLQELHDWLWYHFIPDYTKLRVAVCNVEKQAFSMSGTNAKPPKFCTGGPTNEPPPPPPPPVW